MFIYLFYDKRLLLFHVDRRVKHTTVHSFYRKSKGITSIKALTVHNATEFERYEFVIAMATRNAKTLSTMRI